MQLRLTTFVLLTVCASLGCSHDAGSSRSTTTDTAVAANAAADTNTPPVSSSNRYVGLRYDSLPAGVTYKGGGVISPSPTNGTYDFAHVSTPRGDMIWLDTLGAAPARGQPAKIVRAELVVPPLAADERVFLSSCDVNGKLDPLIVAIVVTEPKVTKSTNVRQAWRANLRAGRFDLIPLSGITCEDPGS
jgi:hypothetical protein